MGVETNFIFFMPFSLQYMLADHYGNVATNLRNSKVTSFIMLVCKN